MVLVVVWLVEVLGEAVVVEACDVEEIVEFV